MITAGATIVASTRLLSAAFKLLTVTNKIKVFAFIMVTDVLFGFGFNLIKLGRGRRVMVAAVVPAFFVSSSGRVVLAHVIFIVIGRQKMNLTIFYERRSGTKF